MAKREMTQKPPIKVRQAKRFAADPVYRKCYRCGGEMEGRHRNYPYRQCGLSNVVLVDVLVFNCSCGEIVVELPSLTNLHRFIAFQLVRKPTLLAGEEIRFLRKHLRYTAADLAGKIGKTNITISRWENGVTEISRDNDRVIRLTFFVAMVEQYAKAVYGPSCGVNLDCLVEFAKRVSSFDLTTLLDKIRDVSELATIRVDPNALAAFSASEAILRGGADAGIVH